MHVLCNHIKLNKVKRNTLKFYFSKYVQGQEPEPKIREYFYYIDHQGMLFLDDSKMKNFTSCFKDKKFLQFFFNQICLNKTGSTFQFCFLRCTNKFPYLSICSRERNFVRCDDYPFVYTNVIEKVTKSGAKEVHLAYNHAGDLLSLQFEPEKIFMLPETGRIYHPAKAKVGYIGLIASKLAIEFSKNFIFDNGEKAPPTKFNYGGKTYLLDLQWYCDAIKARTLNK